MQRSFAAAGKLRRLVAYAWPERRALALVLLLTFLSAALAGLQPWPLKVLVDYGLAGATVPDVLSSGLAAAGLEATPTNLIILAALAGLAMFLVSAALDASLTFVWARAGQHMVYALAGDLFQRLQRLSLIFHARSSVGDFLSRITGDAWCVYSITDALLVTPIKNLVLVGFIAVLAWQLDPGLTALTLVAVPVLVVCAKGFGERLKGAARRSREAIAQVTAFVHQVLGAIPVVQAFGAAPRNDGVFRTLAIRAVAASRVNALATHTFGIASGAVTTIAIAIVVYGGGVRVLAHELTLGSLLVFVAYVRTLEGAARELLAAYATLRAAEASADRALEILDSADVVRERPGSPPLPPRSGAGAGHIVFDHVTFGYERERPVLEELTLEVKPGEVMALVGATGAGKTTLSSLVPRFFDVWSGRVVIDGVDVRAVELASLREEVALVLQDPFILPLTVAENIAYGRPGASRRDIIAAAVAANAHEFITQLDDGYDTVLAEHGATLSGGERQRIAIARALLRDARVLILDEPTSALDARTERSVIEALQRLMAGRTTLIITHRLTSVVQADRIAVLEKGRIAELGTHRELLATGGRYAQLYALQTALPPVSGSLH